MSVRIPSENGTCPCKACQRALARTPAQKEIRKQLKIRGWFKK